MNYEEYICFNAFIADLLGFIGNENLPFTTTNADSLNVNRSFVHTQAMLSPNADSMLQEFQYFDGLGKPIQTVSQGISPTKGDLISTSAYDSMGRISKKWLPLHAQGNNGAFLSDPFNSTVKRICRQCSLSIYRVRPLSRKQNYTSARCGRSMEKKSCSYTIFSKRYDFKP